MQDLSGWIQENRPVGNLDYRRLADATNVVEVGNLNVGPREVLNSRFDYDVAMTYARRRTREASGPALKLDEAQALLTPLVRAWSEGLAFGALVYTEEGRGRSPEDLLDRIALANINHRLASADQDGIDAIFSRVISPKALGFVATVRSFKAISVLENETSDANPADIHSLLAGHWMDGFLMGLVYQELGGHRESP